MLHWDAAMFMYKLRTLSTVADGDERQGEPLQHATTRRFSQKSPAEKEELYERIASQLISIGDTYVISTTPHGDESAGEYTMTVWYIVM